ncbi:MAG TPA: PEP-CTERM sorting domain-containing protein [Pyrinomonadaceae bacterium]|nr:PEP-CTERM sorting domain-containing protein [Pyrinomonadaceae bacterium]
MFALLFELTNRNLLLGFMPESLGLFLFGVGLIGFAVSLRRVFNRRETIEENYKQLGEKINR